jgi:hypothetical protein
LAPLHPQQSSGLKPMRTAPNGSLISPNQLRQFGSADYAAQRTVKSAPGQHKPDCLLGRRNDGIIAKHVLDKFC